MDPERYRKAGEIYHAVLALPPNRRAEYLEQACAADVDLLTDVESLLSAHADAGQFIETPHLHMGSLLQSVLTLPAEDGERSSVSDTSFAPGQQLGRYQIVALLGAGGMGTVYRAVDPTLGREVAIKALTPTFRGDSASLRRFEREARVLATLNHPNIATIYGFERLDGSPYLILERVDGETLADRLSRGSMAIDEAVSLAGQIVAGLEEAHDKGVIHRDLKPSNVMLTADGRVKLVDFGLAKTTRTHPALDVSADPITAPGVVLGTARYMSPEQVKGENVDHRTDVWAFGCVLYEMLTAKPAFAGRTVSEVVAAVLRDDPDWQLLPAEVPANLRRLLRRSLRRESRARLQHIGDARLELMEWEDEAPTDAEQKNRSAASWLWPALTATAVIAALAAVIFMRRPSGDASPAARLSLELPSGLTLGSEFSAPFAVAPAGNVVVLEAGDGTAHRLYVRQLTDPPLRALLGTETARQPFFSTDGAWVGFFAGRKLAKVPLAGGPVVELADIGGNPRGAAWASDGTIVVAPTQTSGLVRIPDRGGRPLPLTTLDKTKGEYSHRWPDVMPGGKWVLFTVGFEDAPFDEARIEAVSIETGERRVLVSGAGFARYLPSGQLLFVRGGHLHVVAFDPERLVVSGAPEVVFDGVRYDPRNGGTHLAASASGTLVYTPGEPISSDHYLAWADRDGRLTRATDTPRPFRDIKVSRDGRRVATVIRTTTEADLWVVDGGGALSRLSFALSPHRPTWTPDGSGITVGAEKDGSWRLVSVAADGKRDPMVLLESANRLYPNAWSPDGRHLLFQESRPDTGWDLRLLEVDSSGLPVGAPRTFADTPFHESSAAISHDGRWVSYESDELDGVVQIYVRSFPDGAQKVRVSPAGARWPTWDTQGHLHYWQTEDNTLQVAQTSERGGQLIVGTPQPVWRGVNAAVLQRVVITVSPARYDVEADGTRFLVLEKSTQGAGPELSNPMIVLGWPIASSRNTR